MKQINKISAVVLAAIIFSSMYISSLPLVSAAYTADYPYMPPDLEGDAIVNGHVNIFDVVLVASHYGFEFGDPDWDPRADLNGDGKIDIYDVTIVTGNFGNVEDDPIAYSTTFEFTVPSDGDNEVWYYVLARVYVPEELSGLDFCFIVDEVDDWVLNVKIDDQPVDVDLGSLCHGYHLLEFEFVEKWAGGKLRFHVATASEQLAWLARFRVYVPNYDETEYEYTIKTTTNFTNYDLYYLTGFADDYIWKFKVDSTQWNEWQWDTGAEKIYAWRDGFLYPVFDGKESGVFNVEFNFSEIWASGLVDFQYVSWEHQGERIGKPRYWSSVELEAGEGLSIYETTVYWGSKWDGDSGTSRRSFETAIEMEVNNTDDDLISFPYKVQLGISVGFLPLAIDKGSSVDMGFLFNLTDKSTVAPGIWLPPSVDLYGQPNGMEIHTPPQAVLIPPTALVYHDTSETSFISPELTVVGDFTGAIAGAFFAHALGAIGFVTFGPIGAVGGEVAGAVLGEGVAQIFHYAAGQTIEKQYETPGDDTYRKLTMDPFWVEDVGTSKTQALFARVIPTYPFHCGSVKVTVQCQLCFLYWRKSGGLAFGLPLDVRVTFVIPMFVHY